MTMHAPNNPKPPQIVDTLRMNDRDLLKLVASRGRKAWGGGASGAGSAPPAEAPEAPALDARLIASLPRVLVRLHDSTANQWTTYLVKPCDLHANGVVFLHGAFVHRKTKCALLLRRSDGQPVQLVGTILNCSHLIGRVHQLVATFDQPISLDEYRFSDGAPVMEVMADDADAKRAETGT